MTLLATVIANSLAFAQIAVSWPGLSYTTTGNLNGSPTVISQSAGTTLDITMQTTDGSFSNFSTLWKTFWFYGTGEGNFVVNVPYSLLVRCEGIAGARAKVALNIGPGTISDLDRDVKEIACSQGEVTLSGILTGSRLVSNPIGGPLVTMHVSTEMQGFATVPEKKALVLVLSGLVLFLFWFLLKGD